jgi:hypothetical protein
MFPVGPGKGSDCYLGALLGPTVLLFKVHKSGVFNHVKNQSRVDDS